jgi:hypothetical protein
MSYADDLIHAHGRLQAQRRVSTVFTAAGRVGVHQPGERMIVLPNGHSIRVSTDASGVATQVEEDEAMHAIVRPRPIRVRRREGGVLHVHTS